MAEIPEARPSDAEYPAWLARHFRVFERREQNYYERVLCPGIKSAVDSSAFWMGLTSNLNRINDEFLKTQKEVLLNELKPQLDIKSFKSFMDKTYRKNILTEDYPNPPSGRWLLPPSWYSDIRDIIRTTIVVRYLDGVEFLVGRIIELAMAHGVSAEVEYESRREGYYAQHIYVPFNIELPTRSDIFEVDDMTIYLEIQITTEIKQTLKGILHYYYERGRLKMPMEKSNWQWDIRSEEFAASNLGHILHYAEAMIVRLREGQKEEKG